MPKIIDNLYFEASIGDQLAVITLKSRAFHFITSLEDSQVLMEFLGETEHKQEGKAVLF